MPYLRASMTGYVLVFALCAAARVHSAPAVFYATDPVGPGQTVILTGEQLPESAKVMVARLADDAAGTPQADRLNPAAFAGLQPVEAEVLQAAPQSVKFVVPTSLKAGVYAWRLMLPDRSSLGGLLNRPALWWAQGDTGLDASPGGWIRVFGKNLGDAEAGSRGVLQLTADGRSIQLPTEGSAWDRQAKLPADLPPGRYRVCSHHGWGGPLGWSDTVEITVSVPRAWPQQVFDVTHSGADSTGQSDATAAIEAALAKADENHGGIVYFPRGRYRLSAGLKIPRFTVLRGPATELTCLYWTESDAVPEALLLGTNSFGIENLTLYTNRYKHVIVGDLGSAADAGDVFLRHVRVRANLYRGHPTPQEVDERFRAALKWSTGCGDTVRLGGRNVEITNCDLYGAGRVLYLSRARGARVADCRLWNGRWGWYCLSGSDGLVFENNQLTGADLMSTGGGLNCLDGSNYSQNVFFARNQMGLTHGWDREIMTTDAGGEAYRGSVTADGTRLQLADDPLPRWKNRDWNGAGVFILSGPGAGQWRRAVRAKGRTVDVDRPWIVSPTADSHVSISMFQGRYLVCDNTFADCGAVQFYGTSIECVMANNRGARMQGFRGLGLDYHGLQPSWYCLFLGNHLTEGNYYHWNSATEAFLQILGNPGPRYQGPINCGAVVRGNTLASNAHLDVRGAVRDAVVEDNSVSHSDQGVFVSQSCAGVVVRNNRFENVVQPMVDEPTLRRIAQERMRALMGLRQPVAAWTFDEASGLRYTDTSSHGFHAMATARGVATVPGRFGACVRLDGTGWLRVEEPAVFNAPDLTVSLWVRPEKLQGRYGLVAKRFAGGAAPWIVSQNGDRIGFEACEENGGKWSFNFTSRPVFKPNAWTQVAVVLKQGDGIILYADGNEVARKPNAAVRCPNNEPLIIGREAWGGDPPSTKQAGIFSGCLDDLKIWSRALDAAEIAAEFARSTEPSGAKPSAK